MERALDIAYVDSLLFVLDDCCYDTRAGDGGVRAEFSLLSACPRGEQVTSSTPLSRALVDIWGRVRPRLSPRQKQRVAEAAEIFLAGCGEEIRTRQESGPTVLSFDDYLHLRRGALGGHLYLILTEYAAEVELADLLAASPDLRAVNALAADHWLFANDLWSFRREYHFQYDP